MKNLLKIITISLFSISGFSQVYVYWTDTENNSIERAKLDGTDREIVLSSQNTPRGIAIDYEHGKLYFADGEKDAITSANLDGSEVLYLNSTPEPIAVLIDKKNNLIYYSDVYLDGLYKMNLDGSNIQEVISGITDIAFFDLDFLNEEIYFTSKQGDNSVIYKVKTDGNEVSKIIEESGYISGLAIDAYDKKLFWLNRGSQKLYSSDLDGRNKLSLTDVSAGCISLSLDNINDKLYWSEKDNNLIRSINVDGEMDSIFMEDTPEASGIVTDLKYECIKIKEVYDTTYISVTDTLIIDVTFTSAGEEEVNSVKVYPNPTKDYIYIDMGDNYNQISNYSINIINASSQSIFSSKFNHSLFQIDIKHRISYHTAPLNQS